MRQDKQRLKVSNKNTFYWEWENLPPSLSISSSVLSSCSPIGCPSFSPSSLSSGTAGSYSSSSTPDSLVLPSLSPSSYGLPSKSSGAVPGGGGGGMLTGGVPGGGPGGGPGGTTPWGRVGGGPGGGPGGINPGGRGLRMNKSIVPLKSKLPVMSRFPRNENCEVHYMILVVC